MSRIPIQINTWYNCIPNDIKGNVELCMIRRPAIPYPGWIVVTYYDGREVYSGKLVDCIKWVQEHYTERRYYN